MLNNTINELVDAVVSCLILGGWASACNGLGVQLLNGQVVAKEQQNNPDYNYIGISDTKGTYCYIRENANVVSLADSDLGSCGIGQTATVQLRAVGVSNNPKNTAQIMADNIYSVLNNCSPKPTTNKQIIYNPSITINVVNTDYADIFAAETGQEARGNLTLAAVDFTLSFDILGCNLPITKLC